MAALKFVAALAAVAMLTVFLAGCSENSGPDPKVEQAKQAQNAPAGKPKVPAEEK